MSPNRRADTGYAAGRRAKALRFFAAADTITAHRLELHHAGDNHNEAVALLRQVQPDGSEPAGHLAALLG